MMRPPTFVTPRRSVWLVPFSLSRRVCLLALLLLGGVLSSSLLSPGLALAADETPAAPPVGSEVALSTPALIEQAFARGEIDAEQRLLYLAYAVYEYESLPPQFHSNVPWHGTAVVAELKRAAANPTLIASAYVQTELARLLNPAAATVCDEPDGPSSAQSADFHVNYGAIGGGLTVDNYLNSLQTTYATLVTSYGWATPPLCRAGLGTCPVANPWGRYPVQIAPLGGGLYGYATVGSGLYTGWVGDNLSTPTVETAAAASCLVLNSDYTGFPGGPQLSLDVTAAHEFAHALQFGLGDPDGSEDDVWYEAIATYYEDEVYDGVNDNYQYLWPFTDICLGEYTKSPYAYWIFPRYVAERNGGTNIPGGGENVIQAFWTNVAAGDGALKAFDRALNAQGTNLADTFHDFAIAMRFGAACPAAAPYCFEEAAGYQESAGPVFDQGSIDTIGGSHLDQLQNNFAAHWIGLPVDGAYSITLRNLSGGGLFHAGIVAKVGSTLVITPLAQLVGGGSEVTLPRYRPPAGAERVVVVITNQNVTADNPSSCTANPYELSTAAVESEVDLALTLTGRPDPVMIHTPLTYTMAVVNNGSLEATNVVVTGTLPSTVVFNTAQASQGSCTAAGVEVVCSLGDLADGDTATATVVVTPNIDSIILSAARVTAAEADANDADNSTGESTVVTDGPSQADLGLSIAGAAGPVYTGDPISYTVTITNAGPGAAANAVLTATLPAGGSFRSFNGGQAGCAQAANGVVCQLGDLPMGTDLSGVLVLAAAQPGPFTTTVTVDSNVPDPVAGNNSAAAAGISVRLHQLYLPRILR